MLHIYHGDGKGKTTAAIGISVRAAGNKKKVVIVQFLKGSKSGEIGILEKVDYITIYRNEKDYGFTYQMAEGQKQLVREMHNRNLESAFHQIKENQCEVLVLDELLSTYNLDLIDRDQVKELITLYKNNIEIIVTGREPDTFFMEEADYITEMKKVKHPYDKGIMARKGIEF